MIPQNLREETMRRLLMRLIACGAIAGFAATVPAAAQEWPVRPVRIIIPLGPGGGGDVFTRLIAEELQKSLGQPFVVENRPGGGLNIGTRACAEAAPDGYTFCVLSGEPVVYNQFTFKSLPFDPVRDLEPVVNLFINANALAVNASLGVKTIPELVALAKAKPGTLSYGTFSFMLVYFMDQLNRKHGIDIVRVPFRSGNEMVTAMVAGSTPIVFLGLSNMLGPIRSGQVNGLALNADRRSPLFPGIPTLAEATGEDYPPPWFGLFAPAGTPAPILDKVHAALRRIMAEPGFRQRNFVERAVDPVPQTRAEFAKFIADNRAFAARVARDAGIVPQ
jgi:tripartite-type tricarboxylate transporter receptor subunit TctC